MSDSPSPQIIDVDAFEPDLDALRPAARALVDGRLVAFPTETVYGLGANALDEHAVRRIFEIKQRPPTSPLIVHLADRASVGEVATEWPPPADRLAEAFWPGPLTLIVPKTASIPDVVTAGLGTVGVRVPAHAVARALIRLANRPVAAPSANRHTGISPTRAEHVVDDLGADVDIVVDGGPTPVGIESTVLSLTGDVPTILRPGMISREELLEVVDDVRWGEDVQPGSAHPSPGMAERHYAPETPIVLVDDLAAMLTAEARREDVGWLTMAEPDAQA